MRCLGFAILMLLAAPAAMAAPSACRDSPLRQGDCFVVQGRLALANGNPSWRIRPTGSNRILGVVDGRHSRQSSEEGGLPDAVRRATERSKNPNRAIFAKFEVCPLTAAHKGHMRDVCIAGFGK